MHGGASRADDRPKLAGNGSSIKLLNESSAVQSNNFENAQEYTMKSLTIDNAAGISSSENQVGHPGLHMSGSSQITSQGPTGLYYAAQGGYQ